jgi:uncharacterized membrane protein YpjA
MMNDKQKFNLGFFLRILRCFNVAAICALSIWYGYVFYANQTQTTEAEKNTFQFQQQAPASSPNLNRA